MLKLILKLIIKSQIILQNPKIVSKKKLAKIETSIKNRNFSQKAFTNYNFCLKSKLSL